MSNPSCSVAADEAHGSRSSPTGLLHGASRRTRPSCWPDSKHVRTNREHGRARKQQGRDEEQHPANKHSMNEERDRDAEHATTSFMSLLSYLVVGILGLLVVEASSLLIVTSLSVKGGSLQIELRMCRPSNHLITFFCCRRFHQQQQAEEEKMSGLIKLEAQEEMKLINPSKSKSERPKLTCESTGCT